MCITLYRLLFFYPVSAILKVVSYFELSCRTISTAYLVASFRLVTSIIFITKLSLHRSICIAVVPPTPLAPNKSLHDLRSAKFFNDKCLWHNSLYIFSEFIICSHILLIILVEYVFISQTMVITLR